MAAYSDFRLVPKVTNHNGNYGQYGCLTCIVATFVEGYRGGASITGVEKCCCNPEVRFVMRRAERKVRMPR